MLLKEKDGFLYFDVSDGLENYSQRNNEYIDEITNKKIAGNMCNVTSYVMAGSYNGYVFPKGRFKQEEDNLLDFIRHDKDVLAYYEKTLPNYFKAWRNNEKDNYPPEQIHDVLCYGFNKWMKYEAAKFKPSAKISDIVKSIIVYNLATVMSGKFGNLGHIVVLVGLKAKKEIMEHLDDENILDYIEEFIIDDPYGDYHTGYKDFKGNNIIMSKEDFVNIFKPLKDIHIKMAHIFNRAPSLV